jgi:sec-independent protein translocase protein TatC
VFYYPYLDIFHNFVIQITSSMQAMLLSSGKAFFDQLRVSVLIGIITSVQIIIRWICQTTEGSRNNKWISPPISLLEAGITFSYIAVIPFALNFRYTYGQAIGVETFLNNQDFISFFWDLELRCLL